MPHAYTEDQLDEQPAIGLFAEQLASPRPHPGPLPTGEGVTECSPLCAGTLMGGREPIKLPPPGIRAVKTAAPQRKGANARRNNRPQLVAANNDSAIN